MTTTKQLLKHICKCFKLLTYINRQIYLSRSDFFHHISYRYLKHQFVFAGSKADKELQLIVGNKRLVKDVRKLSPAQQTSQLEAYHKTVCHFAPKFHHFFYDAMNAR